MAIQLYVFDGAVLTASPVTQGTAVPVNTKRVIKAAILVNANGAAAQATVSVSNGSGVTLTLILNRTLAAGESYTCPELINQGLNAGGYIQAIGAGMGFKYSALDFIQ